MTASDTESLDAKDNISPQANRVINRGASVVVRVRPLSTKENADPTIKNCIQCLKESLIIGIKGMYAPKVSETTKSKVSPAKPPLKSQAASRPDPRPQQFAVDTVFHPHSTQIEVYEGACKPIVESVFRGINGCILAYGATGSGKTHTMFGGMISAAGVIYQAIQDIFDEKERLEEDEGKFVTIKCSFLEVYNEEVFDLLVPCGQMNAGKTTGQALHVRDPGKMESTTSSDNPDTLHISGLSYLFPETVEEFAKGIQQGHSNRFVASTSANSQSSRSHAIITVEVRVSDNRDMHRGTCARIRFCDLAGSERAASTSNTGIRLREGGNINRSLLALGSVIQALAQRKHQPQKEVYVPYRGSKLTRLLQDCLGGNCQTQLLFCLSPSNNQYEESLNTMLFAMQAKEVQIAARRNEFNVNPAAVAENQELIIEELRLQLAAARDELKKHRTRHPQANTIGTKPTSGEVPHGSLQQKKGSKEGSPPAHSKASAPYPTSNAGPTSPDVEEARVNRKSASPQPDFDRALSSGPSTRRERSSTLAEGTPVFTKLQEKFKSYCTQKEQLYRTLRDTEDKASSLEARIRDHKWKLASFLASQINNHLKKKGSSDHGNKANGELIPDSETAVGISGLRKTIAKLEEENSSHDTQLSELTKKLDSIDARIESTKQELLREKQHTSLELLLDNARLRESCTEAECLAAHYHQECRTHISREKEYAHALSICVGALKAVLPSIQNQNATFEQCTLALLYSALPAAETKDMAKNFEASLLSGVAPQPNGSILVSSNSSSDQSRAVERTKGSEAELRDAIPSYNKSNRPSNTGINKRTSFSANISQDRNQPQSGVSFNENQLNSPGELRKKVTPKGQVAFTRSLTSTDAIKTSGGKSDIPIYRSNPWNSTRYTSPSSRRDLLQGRPVSGPVKVANPFQRELTQGGSAGNGVRDRHKTDRGIGSSSPLPASANFSRSYTTMEHLLPERSIGALNPVAHMKSPLKGDRSIGDVFSESTNGAQHNHDNLYPAAKRGAYRAKSDANLNALAHEESNGKSYPGENLKQSTSMNRSSPMKMPPGTRSPALRGGRNSSITVNAARSHNSPSYVGANPADKDPGQTSNSYKYTRKV